VSETEWRLALNDGGFFLDAWGNDAAGLGLDARRFVRRRHRACLAAWRRVRGGVGRGSCAVE